MQTGGKPVFVSRDRTVLRQRGFSFARIVSTVCQPRNQEFNDVRNVDVFV